MNDMRSVTAVITTYRRPARLVHCLRGVFAQTYPGVEAVVIHDGAAPGLAELLKREFPEEFLKGSLTLHQTPSWNGRPAPGRNLGIALSRGEFVAFCDDDDYWFPEKIELQLACLDQSPECDGVFSDYHVRFDEEPVIYDRSISQDKFEAKATIVGVRELIRRNGLCLSSSLLRKAALPEKLFPEARFCRAFEDWCAWLKLSLSGSKFAFIEDELLSYLANNPTSIRKGRVSHNFRLISYSVPVLIGSGRYVEAGMFLASRFAALGRGLRPSRGGRASPAQHGV